MSSKPMSTSRAPVNPAPPRGKKPAAQPAGKSLPRASASLPALSREPIPCDGPLLHIAVAKSDEEALRAAIAAGIFTKSGKLSRRYR